MKAVLSALLTLAGLSLVCANLVAWSTAEPQFECWVSSPCPTGCGMSAVQNKKKCLMGLNGVCCSGVCITYGCVPITIPPEQCNQAGYWWAWDGGSVQNANCSAPGLGQPCDDTDYTCHLSH